MARQYTAACDRDGWNVMTECWTHQSAIANHERERKMKPG
jgi:hypothetical protein